MQRHRRRQPFFQNSFQSARLQMRTNDEVRQYRYAETRTQSRQHGIAAIGSQRACGTNSDLFPIRPQETPNIRRIIVGITKEGMLAELGRMRGAAPLRKMGGRRQDMRLEDLPTTYPERTIRPQGKQTQNKTEKQ